MLYAADDYASSAFKMAHGNGIARSSGGLKYPNRWGSC